MSEDNARNAVRLYVFVDTPEYTSARPITVIINKYKSIENLKKEFHERRDYLVEEQHWVINNTYCYDQFEIMGIVKDMVKFKKGYIAFMYIMTEEERSGLIQYHGSYLENRYRNTKPEDRWNEPEKTPLIIADIVDITKPRPLIGWTCDFCTFLNKPFIKFCDTCSNSRPENFEIPKDFYFTKEDKERMKKDKEIEERAKKLEEETLKRIEEEKLENLRNLRDLYKKNLALTSEVTECPTCLMECPAGEGVILRNCLHTICKDCFKEYLISIDDPQMKCFDVDCVGHIEDQEIREVLTEAEFDRYQQLSLRTAESKAENSFHCKTPNCVAWAIYDDNVNFFNCPACKQINCLLCKAIHPNQTCKEYQDELAIKARNDEAAKKDLAFLQNLIATGQAMQCPGCQIIVQKKSGCDWMQCNMCKKEICWATKGPRWGPKGKGDTSGGCKCRVGGVRCHPQCGNCH